MWFCLVLPLRSYADDEDRLVTDPHLAEHLSFWGIDIMKLEKTDKTLGVRILSSIYVHTYLIM